MFVKPAPGLKIRDPELKDFLPDEGREVAESPYWSRRIRDNDVTVSSPQPADRSESE